MRPLEGVGRKSPVSRGKRKKQKLGSPRRSWPRTLDSSQSGTGAHPKKPVTRAASVPNGIGNGAPSLQRGKETEEAGARESSFQWGMDLLWNLTVPGGSSPHGSRTPPPSESNQPSGGGPSACSSPHYAASYLNNDLTGLDTHTHTHTHTHSHSHTLRCLLKPDMRSFLKFISKPPSLPLSSQTLCSETNQNQ